jgi:YfiH family protein
MDAGVTFAHCRQVHGSSVHTIRALADAHGSHTEADALTTNQSGILVGVKTADCVPVLIADRGTGAVAAVHAGWRGAASHIVERTLAAMIHTWGTSCENCLAAIGPAVCARCYEVGPEVVRRFEQEFGYARRLLAGRASEDANGQTGKMHLDLKLACRIQLEMSGLTADQLSEAPYCTICDNDLFYSYRKEGDRAGRILTVVGRR